MGSPPARFGSVVTAMVTPFDDAGALDVDGAARLARVLAAQGSDGLVVAGTTGESPVLSDRELGDLWRAVAEAVTVPVIAGTGTNDTRHSIELSRLAADAGVDGLLVVTPYYSRPPQSGLFEHFSAVARATDLPVLLYDIPVRTGRRIDPDVILRLARDVPNIVGVKDATGDLAGAARLVAAADAGFQLYCGDDALTLPFVAVGAVGVVSVAGNWAGEEMGELVAAAARGELDAAQAANARLLESYAFQSSEVFPNPLPAKAACRVLGLPAGQCRPPLGAAPAELEDRARLMLAHLGREVPAPAGAGTGGPLA
ncbi:MAG TPA: 4-hydroxy-tetrahydrodipicolinate synthase [Acidimicrobiales bacterium]|nr:4-hydroxy-tetrahydrodipicolinate synthase [Acidimicrobiales bacterium]